MKTQFSHFGDQEWRSGKSIVAFYQCGLGSILKAATKVEFVSFPVSTLAFVFYQNPHVIWFLLVWVICSLLTIIIVTCGDRLMGSQLLKRHE